MNKKRYYRGSKNVFYYTDDNWKNYIKECNLKEGYDLEDNANVKTEIRLKEDFGKEKANILINELKSINKILISKGIFGKEQKDGYGAAFEVFSIYVLHNFEYKKIIDCFLVIGSNDGKIDAIVFDNGECFVYQIKLSFIENGVIDEARENVREFIESDQISGPKTGDLFRFCQAHSNYFNECEPKYFDISCNGNGCNHYDSTLIFNKYFENQIIYQDFKANKFSIKIPIEKRISNQDGKEEKNYAWLNTDKAYFTFVKASDLAQQIDLITEGKQNSLEKLFGFNVRGFNGKNKEMISTIENEPTNFCLYNNGISIVGKCRAGDYLTISEPYVVNGQQTLLNLLDNKDKLENIYIPLFVKNYDSNNTLMNIAKYNNQQKAIKAKDLLSISANVREIQKQLFDDSDYYLNILSSGKKKYMKIVNKIYGAKKIIQLVDFLRAYSIVTTESNLGSWKNSLSSSLEKEFIKENNEFNIEKAIETCKIVEIEKEIINEERSKYAISSVALEYVLHKTNIDKERSKLIIDSYIKTFYDDLAIENRPRNKADIFKKADSILKNALDNFLTQI